MTTDIEAQIATYRARAAGNPAAEAYLPHLEKVLRAAAAPEDDASAELRGLAMSAVKRFEEILRG